MSINKGKNFCLCFFNAPIQVKTMIRSFFYYETYFFILSFYCFQNFYTSFFSKRNNCGNFGLHFTTSSSTITSAHGKIQQKNLSYNAGLRLIKGLIIEFKKVNDNLVKFNCLFIILNLGKS